MADYIRPTPRNPILGLLADALTGGVQYMRDPRRAQQMQGLGGLLAETGIPATMERLSYGEPLTKGRGMTTRLRPEAEAALMTLGPEAVPIGRGAMAGVRAAERGAMAAGRAGERYAERVVPQVMERGGLPAQMLQDLAQGSRSNVYLPDTPGKPNPLVGTRYQTVQEPGIVPRRPINYDELLGGSIMTYPTDMLSRNVRVTNVSDVPLGSNSFVTPGGLMYMMDQSNIANKIGYASNQSAATSQNNRALRAIEENLAMGGTGRVFMAPHTMPRGGENFSTGPTLGLLSLIDTTNPSPALLDELSDRIRGATVKGVKGKYKDFVGLNDPAASIQLLTGEGLLAGSPGDLRKVFVDKVGSVAGEKGMGFNYKDLQNAILDPNVMNKPSFLMGDSIYEALPQLGTRRGTHAAYGFDMPGVFVGNTRGAPISEFMKPLYEQVLPTQMNKPGPRPGVYADPDQLTRGKLSTAGEGISMFMDEEQIKRLRRLLGDD
jgi:hypothetical protein